LNLWGYVDIVGKPSIQTNLYLYTSADPVNIIDPLGLQGLWHRGGPDSPLRGFYSQVRAYVKIIRDLGSDLGSEAAWLGEIMVDEAINKVVAPSGPALIIIRPEGFESDNPYENLLGIPTTPGFCS